MAKYGLAAGLWLALSASPASAQLLGGGLGSLPQAGAVLRDIPSTVQRGTARLDGALDETLARTRAVLRDTVGRPRIDAVRATAPDGAPIVAGQILAIAPGAAALATARSLGFTVLRQDHMPALGLSTAVLAAPDGMDAPAALAALRKADPAGQYDYNHLYDPGGDSISPAAPPASAPPSAGAAEIGMIDGGIDHSHPALADATIVTRDFAGSGAGPATAHGTAIASLLVGRDGAFRGALSGAALYAADVYGGKPDGGSAEDVARALAWMAKEGVPVVNVSLCGPKNALLAAATAAFIRRGHVLVAAVGNNGPAAPPNYPAAYPGVVGVTSVDARDAVQLDANQGGDVAFAARGVDVRAAALKGGYANVTGTSFAAPLIAARFALLVAHPDIVAVRTAWTRLEHSARDLGAPGRDPVFGYGLLDGPQTRVVETAAGD